MLSGEEKKAIEYFNTETRTEAMHYGAVLVNLIEKQSKEIEELKENNKTLKNLQNDTNGLYIGMIERKNYFERELQKLEDKIKAKIEESEKQQKEEPDAYLCIKVLQSLLEKE